MEMEAKKKYRKCRKGMKLTHQEALKLQVNLECVLLALLSNRFKYVITVPQKRTKSAVQFIKVKEMILTSPLEEQFTFNIQKFIKVRSAEYVIRQVELGINAITAQRRMQDMKHIETIHLYEDILGLDYIVEKGYEDRDGIHGDVNIFYEQKLMYSKEEIERIGSEIYQYLNQKLLSNAKVIEHAELSSFLSK